MAASTMTSFLGSTQCFTAKNVTSARGQVIAAIWQGGMESSVNLLGASLAQISLSNLCFMVVTCTDLQPVCMGGLHMLQAGC